MVIMEWTTLENSAHDAVFTVGTTASNAAKVTVQLKDWAGNNLTAPNSLVVYLSDVATGLDVISTAIGTELAVNANGSLAIMLSKKVCLMTTEATGIFDIDLEDGSNKSTFYLVVVMPDGRLEVSTAVDLGD